MRGSIRKRGDTYRYHVDLPPDLLTYKLSTNPRIWAVGRRVRVGP
jgi:hypothetical protein